MNDPVVRREEVESALAARHELGREYEPEIVDNLVERLERRLDARERRPGGPPARRDLEHRSSPAVAFERELVLERVEGRFDPLADAAEGAEARLFVFAVGAQQRAAERGDELFEFAASEAFVADHDLAGLEYTLEQLGGHSTFGRVCRCEFEADRQPVGAAEQVEPEAPEPAAV